MPVFVEAAETVLEWGTHAVGTTPGQIGIAAILLVVALESRHVRHVGRSATVGLSIGWWILILLGLLAAGGGVTIHSDVILEWVGGAVEMGQDAIGGLL